MLWECRRAAKKSRSIIASSGGRLLVSPSRTATALRQLNSVISAMHTSKQARSRSNHIRRCGPVAWFLRASRTSRARIPPRPKRPPFSFLFRADCRGPFVSDSKRQLCFPLPSQRQRGAWARLSVSLAGFLRAKTRPDPDLDLKFHAQAPIFFLFCTGAPPLPVSITNKSLQISETSLNFVCPYLLIHKSK